LKIKWYALGEVLKKKKKKSFLNAKVFVRVQSLSPNTVPSGGWRKREAHVKGTRRKARGAGGVYWGLGTSPTRAWNTIGLSFGSARVLKQRGGSLG